MSVRVASHVALALVAAGSVLALAGCAGTGASRRSESAAIRALQREARPIGVGPRYRSRARGPILGPCRATLGARTATHVEVFAHDHVVLLPTGIGVARPWRFGVGRIVGGRCFGAVVTLDPTGTALVRRGVGLTLAALFRSWGVSLSSTRLADFSAPVGGRVRAFVDGRPRGGDPGDIPLAPDAEIVLEVGPDVPPHHSYAFPPPYGNKTDG